MVSLGLGPGVDGAIHDGVVDAPAIGRHSDSGWGCLGRGRLARGSFVDLARSEGRLCLARSEIPEGPDLFHDIIDLERVRGPMEMGDDVADADLPAILIRAVEDRPGELLGDLEAGLCKLVDQGRRGGAVMEPFSGRWGPTQFVGLVQRVAEDVAGGRRGLRRLALPDDLEACLRKSLESARDDPGVIVHDVAVGPQLNFEAADLSARVVDVHDEPVDDVVSLSDAHFCVPDQLSWLRGSGAPTPGA